MMKSIGKEFVEKTKYEYLEDDDYRKGFPPPPVELEYDKTKRKIDLPDPKNIKVDMGLVEAIEKRRSLRRYSEKPISLAELSYLLWCTQGVIRSSKVATLRNVASAGSRHAFETYIMVNNVDKLEPGIYRYLALEHKLLVVRLDPNIAEKAVKVCYGQQNVGESAVTFFWVAVPYRTTYRYGERGYRYIYLDAGHVCQNLYLSAEGINCGVCAIGAYCDDEANEFLNIDGEEQFVIYIAALGKR
ncbi:MAG: SagB/ThcOx family dehydrogenase [Tepidanaerobacteraceae bacterium]